MAKISGGNLIGAFPVFDTSRSVGTYTANLQKQAAQRAAEQKALQDDLNKIKIDGLRDADKEDYFKGFEDWRNTAQSALKERDFRKKAQLQSESDRKYLELQSLVNKSKEYNKIHNDVSGRLLDNKFRDQFTDDAVEVWRKSGNLPLSSKEIVTDPTALARQLDLSGIQKTFADIDEDLLKQARYGNPQTRRITSGNKVGTESIYSRSVDPKRQALEYANLYDTKRDVRAFMQKQYPEQFATMPEEEAKAFAIQDFVAKRPVARQDTPRMDWDRAPDNFYAHYNYRLANPLESNVTSAPRNLQLPFGKDESNNTTARNSVFIPSANKNFVGSDAIDLKTGKPIKLTQSSNDYEMVALLEVPFLKKGKITAKDAKGKVVSESESEGTLAQTDFAKNNKDKVDYKPMIQVQFKDPNNPDRKKNYLIPIDRLPDNLTKKDQALADQFKKSIGYSKPTASKQEAPKMSTSSKMVTMILPNGQSGQIPSDKVSAFLKKYPKAKKQ